MMKPSRLIVPLAACALVLAACKEKADNAAEVAPSNPLLTFVPADTPYLFANLETTPADVVDAYLARFQPTLDILQTMLDDLRVDINPDGSGHPDQVAIMAALLHEIDGKLNRRGLESLGLSLESHKAFYGLGSFPVMRVALKDPALLRAAIARVEAEAGIHLPVAQAGGIDYWRLAGAGRPAGLYAAILDDHLAVGVFPPALEDELLPEFLGLAEPAQVFDANRALAALNRDKGFLQYGSGYVDFQRLADELFVPESRTRRGLAAEGRVQWPTLDAACEAEIDRLIDKAPRMVFGTTELTADTLALRYQVELQDTLAGDLMRLVSRVPVAGEESGDMMSMALGIQAGRLREYLLEKLTAAANDPFDCPQLQGLNQTIRSALAQVNRPMPPFIGNLNGFRLRLESVDLADPSPQNVRGMLVVEVEKPQMLIGTAQMLVPGLEDLQLEPGSAPVEVPEELLRVSVEDLHILAAMSSDALGISLGKDQQASLVDFLEVDADNDGTFFSVSYDMAAQMEFQNRMRDRMLEHAAADGNEATDATQMLERVRELERAYQQMLGRARLEFRFTPAGFEVYNRMTFD